MIDIDKLRQENLLLSALEISTDGSPQRELIFESLNLIEVFQIVSNYSDEDFGFLGFLAKKYVSYSPNVTDVVIVLRSTKSEDVVSVLSEYLLSLDLTLRELMSLALSNNERVAYAFSKLGLEKFPKKIGYDLAIYSDFEHLALTGAEKSMPLIKFSADFYQIITGTRFNSVSEIASEFSIYHRISFSTSEYADIALKAKSVKARRRFSEYLPDVMKDIL